MDKLNIVKETAQHFKEYDFYTTLEYEDFLWLTEQAAKVCELEDEIKRQKEAIDKAVPVLKYYANDENYTYQEREIKWGESITHFKQSEIEKDRGEKARKLLRLE